MLKKKNQTVPFQLADTSDTAVNIADRTQQQVSFDGTKQGISQKNRRRVISFIKKKDQEPLPLTALQSSAEDPENIHPVQAGNIVKCCARCTQCRSLDDDRLYCVRKGPVAPGNRCRHFKEATVIKEIHEKTHEEESRKTEQDLSEVQPEGKKEETALQNNRVKQKKRKWPIFVKLLVLAAIIACGVYMALPLFDNSEISISYYVIDADEIIEPVRISFLSDLHSAEFGENNEALIEAVRMQEPDIIAMGGDMINSDETDLHVILDLCRELSEIAPVYYVFGNHDFHNVLFTDSGLLEELTEAGVHVLYDSYETIEINGSLIDIGGLCEDPGQFAEYGQTFWESYMQSENYRLLLVHDPAYFDSGSYKGSGGGALIGEDVDLALCGHRHGGQIIIPGVGGLYHPDTGLFPQLYGGLYQVEDTAVVVSRGLGNETRIPRINNKPEVVCVVIS